MDKKRDQAQLPRPDELLRVTYTVCVCVLFLLSPSVSHPVLCHAVHRVTAAQNKKQNKKITGTTLSRSVREKTHCKCVVQLSPSKDRKRAGFVIAGEHGILSSVYGETFSHYAYFGLF